MGVVGFRIIMFVCVRLSFVFGMATHINNRRAEIRASTRR